MDSGQVIAFLLLLLTGCMIAAGVVYLKRATVRTAAPPIRQAKRAVIDWDKARIERYNNLPPLGKARSDKRSAQIAKYGGTAGAVGFVWLLSLINPFTLPRMLVAALWARRNWNEQSDSIKEADERRDEILR